MALSDQTRFSGDAEMEQRSVAQVREPSARYLVHAEFKQSGVGLIPNDWSLIGLGEIAELDVGLSKPKIIFGKGCPVVTVQDLYAGSIIDVAVLKRVFVTTDEIKKYRLTRDDILIGNASVKRDGIGYANRFDGASEDVIFAKYAYRARTLDSLLPLYLHHVLRAAFCRQWMVANSQTGTLTNLNKSAAKAIPITVPPTIEEQRAIATALSDVDALIAGLERLIAKKRDIKQAAMQQLLTGQTRLPGFSGEWEVKRLGDLADLIRQNIVPAHQPDQAFMHFSLPAFDAGKSASFELGSTIGSNKFGVPTNAVLLSKLNPRIPRVWAPEDVPSNSCASTEWLVLTPRPGTERKFLFVLCCSPNFSQQMELAATGTTGSHQRISPGTALDIRAPIPLDETEQSAIATVLSDMDADLSALESRLAKTRAIKQGMMQELLTGRIRLV